MRKKFSEVRKKGIIGYLRPDGKTQVSVKYSDGVPVGIDTVLVSAQHDEGVSQEQIRRDIMQEVIERVVPQNYNGLLIIHNHALVFGIQNESFHIRRRKIIAKYVVHLLVEQFGIYRAALQTVLGIK